MKKCRILSLSDLHLGHYRVPSSVLVERLMTYVMPYLPETDLFCLSGDVFDRSLHLTDTDTRDIISWILDVLKIANDYNVHVRVLRGTFSHDRDQPSIFKTLYEKYGFTNDVKYVDTLSIEYIKDLDIKMLYLPDDLPYSSSEACLETVHQLMTDAHWKHVDYAMCHGYFYHVLPPNIPSLPKVTFRADQFSFVSRYVLCGHIHEQSAYGHILYNGSFDRLAHNEESPKGFYYIEDDGKKAHIQFIENKDASTFHTIDVSLYDSPDEAISAYLEALKPCLYRKNSIHIRAVHPNSEIRNALKSLTYKRYPYIAFSVKSPNLTKQEKEQTETTLPEDDLKYLSAPRRDALPDMITSFIQDLPETLTRDRILHHLNTSDI